MSRLKASLISFFGLLVIDLRKSVTLQKLVKMIIRSLTPQALLRLDICLTICREQALSGGILLLGCLHLVAR